MRFQIHQFIEVEDKIAGPLTLKQLLYLLGAGAISFIGYFIFPFWIWLLLTTFVAVIGISLAFVRYNGQPLIKIIISALNFFWQPRMYLWQRELKTTVIDIPNEKVLEERKNLKDFSFGMPSIGKLWNDLTTTKNPIPRREKTGPIKQTDSYSVFRKLTGEKEVAKRVDYR